jgi:hypothetical protein
MTATSGLRCVERFGKFSRNGLWARTFSDLLIGTGDWYSMKCRLIWKLKGTKYRRMYFQLAVSTLPTDGTGFGLLPTITASFGERGGMLNPESNHDTEKAFYQLQQKGLLPTPQAIDGNGKGRELRLKKDCNRDPDQPGSWRGDLKDYAAMSLLPTPNLRDYKSPNRVNSESPYSMLNETIHKIANMECGLVPSDNRLKYAMSATMPTATNLIPTPSVRDFKGANGEDHLQNGSGRKHLDQLPNHLKFQHGITGQLNPRFVMEMMGFPPDYLELPFLNGETKASKQWEMQ